MEEKPDNREGAPLENVPQNNDDVFDGIDTGDVAEKSAGSNTNVPDGIKIDSIPESRPAVPGYSGLPIQSPKKSKKVWLWVLLVIVLLAAAGGAAYYYLVVNKPAPATTPTQTAVKTPAPLTADQIVAAVKKLDLQGKLQTIVKSTATEGDAANNVVVYSAWPYSASGRLYANDPEKAVGAGTTGTPDQVSFDYESFTSYLTNNQFADTKKAKTIDDVSLVHDNVYVSSKVVCWVQEYDHSKATTAPEKALPNTTSISCSDLSSYDKNATALDPIYKALAADKSFTKNSPADSTLYLSNLKVNDGASGAKNATVAIAYVGATLGTGQAYLYQTAGKDWTYLDMNQNELDCSKVTTADQKQAFAGQKCMDYTTQKESTVSAS